MVFHAEATDLPVLSFKGTSHPYLDKTSMTARRYFTPRLNLEKSTKSAAHILSIPLTKTLRFLNFLFIGLCNSSANNEAFFY